jgi:hypothetical protein
MPGMNLTALLGQIPLSPPLSVRLIALVVVEFVLLALAAVLWIKYEQFKKVPVDEWWERRKRAGISPRVRRMMEESHEQYLAEEREAAEGGVRGSGESPGAQAPP